MSAALSPAPALPRVLDQRYAVEAVGALREHPDNARLGDEHFIDESITENGFYGAVVVDDRPATRGHVLVGNNRYRRLARLGGETVPVLWVTPDDDAHARRIMLADNRASDRAGYERQRLLELLEAATAEPDGLKGTGYGEEALESLLTEINNEEHRRQDPRLGPPVELVELSMLRPHPDNYHSHPDDQLDELAASLREHGFYRTVVVARDLTILAGHGIVAAAKRIGMTRAPVFRLDIEAHDARALKVLAGDNELPRFADRDDRKLTEILKTIRGDDPENLRGTGYTDDALSALVMVTRPAKEIRSIDEAAEWLGMPDYESGSHAIQLSITFPTKAAREAFVKEKGIRIDKSGDATNWSTRWPWTDREDNASVTFTTEDAETSDGGEAAAP